MKLRIVNTEMTIKIISWIQIAGGIYGLGLLVWLLQKTESINGALLLIFLTGLTLYILSICSGRYLLSKANLKLGLILSLINFLFQIVNFKIWGYGLSYSSGIDLLIGIENGFKFHIGLIVSDFSMSINSNVSDFTLKFNLASIFILWVLMDIYDEIYSKKDLLLNDDLK